MKNRNEYLVNNKLALVKNLDIFLEGMEVQQVMIVKSNISLEKAKKDIKEYIEKKNLSKKLKNDLMNNLDKAIIHQEYFDVVGSLFHVSSVEFSYSYYLDGRLIDITPHVYNTNIDIDVFDCLFDGGYEINFNDEKVINTKYEEIPVDDIVEEFEEGFLAHIIGNDEHDYDQKRSMKLMNEKLYDKLKKLKGEELGKSRRISSINIVDKKYDYREVNFVVPFYVFNYDTGKQIITITYNAYNGKISEPIINNPLSLIKYTSTDGTAKPKFNIVVFLLTMCIFIGFLYLFDYLSKSYKYNKNANKTLPYEEIKPLI